MEEPCLYQYSYLFKDNGERLIAKQRDSNTQGNDILRVVCIT
jgi:hypothetical protein